MDTVGTNCVLTCLHVDDEHQEGYYKDQPGKVEQSPPVITHITSFGSCDPIVYLMPVDKTAVADFS